MMVAVRAIGAARGARREEPEWTVLLTVAIALLLGLLLQASVTGRMETRSAGGVTVSYPAGWVPMPEEGALVSAMDLYGGGALGARVSVREASRSELVPAEATLTQAATAWTARLIDRLSGLQVLRIGDQRVGGRDAATIEYVFLARDPQGGPSTVPGLMRAIDTLVTSGDRVYVLTFAAESNDFRSYTTTQFPRFRNPYHDIRNSWRVP